MKYLKTLTAEEIVEKLGKMDRIAPNKDWDKNANAGDLASLAISLAKEIIKLKKQ